jgi:hypothetical protein
MLENQLDQTALSGAEVPMDASACQAMEERDRLLRKEFFKVVAGHFTIADRVTC